MSSFYLSFTRSHIMKPYRYENKKSIFFYIHGTLIAKTNKKSGKTYWITKLEYLRELASSYFTKELCYKTKEQVLEERAKEIAEDIGLHSNTITIRSIMKTERKVKKLQKAKKIRQYLYGTKSYENTQLLSSKKIYPKIAKKFAEKHGYSLLKTIITSTHLRYQMYYEVNYSSILYNMINLETKWVKRITNLLRKDKESYNSYVISDTAKMLNDITEYVNLDTLPRFQTVNQMHDYLSKELQKIRKKLVIYEYKKEEIEKFKHNINGVDFRFPTSNHELVEVGIEMGNCVGSYDRIHKENNRIIIGYKEDKPILCMQIQGGKCIQCEGNHSRIPSEEDKALALLYFEKIRVKSPWESPNNLGWW